MDRVTDYEGFFVAHFMPDNFSLGGGWDTGIRYVSYRESQRIDYVLSIYCPGFISYHTYSPWLLDWTEDEGQSALVATFLTDVLSLSGSTQTREVNHQTSTKFGINFGFGGNGSGKDALGGFKGGLDFQNTRQQSVSNATKYTYAVTEKLLSSDLLQYCDPNNRQWEGYKFQTSVEKFGQDLMKNEEINGQHHATGRRLADGLTTLYTTIDYTQ